MNERIRELAEQAGGHFSTHILTSYPAQRRESIGLWDKNIEKFAELIVKECAMFLDQKTEVDDDGTVVDVPLASEMLKHFGVE